MRKYAVMLSFALIFTIALAYLLAHHQDEPKEVISKFMQTCAKKDMNLLIPFVTNEPDYVTRKKMEAFDAVYGDSESNSNSTNINSGIPVSPSNRKREGKELVEHLILVDHFFYMDRYLKEIVSFKQHGNEARARVRLGSKDNDRSIQDFDFFLYQEKDGWKIFQIEFPKPNERNDFYRFYANLN